MVSDSNNEIHHKVSEKQWLHLFKDLNYSYVKMTTLSYHIISF